MQPANAMLALKLLRHLGTLATVLAILGLNMLKDPIGPYVYVLAIGGLIAILASNFGVKALKKKLGEDGPDRL